MVIGFANVLCSYIYLCHNVYYGISAYEIRLSVILMLLCGHLMPNMHLMCVLHQSPHNYINKIISAICGNRLFKDTCIS